MLVVGVATLLQVPASQGRRGVRDAAAAPEGGRTRRRSRRRRACGQRPPPLTPPTPHFGQHLLLHAPLRRRRRGHDRAK